ncbi:POTRA domain-containing protein, partial [Vibrio sp. 10N.222.54.F6]|uniref:POTRA domain-containing protein n=1 Tax=Vibrio sp. 10N.222.54.F6 TaxID=3229645 RepID=UPI00354FFDB5
MISLIRTTSILTLLFGFLLSPFAVFANDLLTLKVEGVTGSLERNVKAHLGTLPKSDVQRRAFIFNAEDN